MDTASTGDELAGYTVLVTRERPGELGRLLSEHGATVRHVPLIAVVDPPDGGSALASELERLADFDWLIVTSAAGAERVGAAARANSSVALAAVGTATAKTLAELAGRPVDLVPDRQLADALADALIARLDSRPDSRPDSRGEPAAVTQPARVLIAQADRAADTLHRRLLDADIDVTTVTAYSTELRIPDPNELAGADVLALASGSAAKSWVEATRPATEWASSAPLVVTIGPTTAAVAARLGLKVDAVAADHSLQGLVNEVIELVGKRRLPDQA